MAKMVLDISKYDEGIDLRPWISSHDLWGVIIKFGGNERVVGGRYVDRIADEHYRHAKELGLHIGAYYYTDVVDINEAIADADHFSSILSKYEFDLPCYMDVEDGRQFDLSRRDLTDIIKAFCDRLNSHGYYAGLYTGGHAWLYSMYSDELICYANWIAWWKSTWPSEAGNIGMWQQGTMHLDGTVLFEDTGLDGYVDLDWCCVDYPARISGESKSQENNENTESNEVEEPETYGRASDAINAAYAELGYYAPADPEPGSKFGRWMAELFNEDWLAGPSNEIWWCCMFVSFCLDKARVEMDGFPTYNTDLALNGGARKYEVDKYDVRYGDIIIFDWNWDGATDHIGFATGEYDGYGFTTIEGNIGNAVCEMYRQMGNVAYVLRPPYEAYGYVSDNIPNVSNDPKNNRDGGSLDIDGIGGWNTLIDWQNQLGTIEDGQIDGQISSNRKYFEGISKVVCNDGGSKFVMSIQSKVGTTVDGYWGINTSMAIQRWLSDHGYDLGPDGVDGYFGKMSTMALQKSLNDHAWK